MNSRPKIPWSHGDKFLMLMLGLVLPSALGLTLWSRALDRNPNVSIPTPVVPTPNARDYYIAAGNAVIDSDKISFAVGSWNPATKPSGDNHFYSPADKEKLVAENAGAINTLHTGFQCPYQEPPHRSFSATFSHYQKMRTLARLLFLQAQVDSGKGDWGGSVGADLDAVQLGETMPRGGPLIGMLVGDACQAIGRRHAWDAVDHLSATEARAAARRLETIRAARVPFADVLQEEEWETQASLLEMMHRRDWPGDILASFSPDQQGNQLASNWQTAPRIRLAGKRNIMANYTRYMDQSIADARRPYPAHLPDPPSPSDPVNQILLPFLTEYGGHLDDVKAETQNALLLTMLALRAYRLDHGAGPPTLSALVPRYLPAVPADPFALSGPLRFKRVGAKSLLYSVGPDGKDDGGRAIFDRTLPAPTNADGYDRRRAVQENSAGDVVAGVNTS